MSLGFDVSCCITIIILVLFSGKLCETPKKGLPLSDYIHHFEPLFYDHEHLQTQHHRTAMENPFTFQFSAHNRLFRLRLKRDLSVFADDYEFMNTHHLVKYDTSRALTGHLEDNDDSSIEAVVTLSGLLDGVVKVGDEEFYIEPAEKYIKTSRDFHSVIYRLSDVHFPQNNNLSCLSHLIHLHSKLAQPIASRQKREIKGSGSIYENQKHCCDHMHLNLKTQNSHHKKHGTARYHLNTTKFPRHMRPKIETKSVYSKGMLKQLKSHHKHQRKLHVPDSNHVHSSISFSNKQTFDASGHAPLSYNSISSEFKTKNKQKTSIIPKLPYSKFGSILAQRKFHRNIIYNHTENKPWAEFHRFDDYSHEDYSGSYSKGFTSHIESNENSVAYETEDLDSSRRGAPDMTGTEYNKKASTGIQVNHIDSSKDDDIPYWRELDALHYTEDGRTGSSEPYGVRSIQRTQWTEDREQRHVAVDRRKSTCLLYLQADHLFYQKMGSEEACIEAMTRHVQRVNSIYRSTDFDQDGRPDNISFLIKRIKVHTSPDHSDYRFIGNYGVEKFLELFSEDDYDAFCLAYMFTYRDFEGGTLGLAWTGDLKNAGGVCEKNGHYRGSLKSLNTGIITLLNYGKHVPPVVSHVTLAHEIGHNFGSPHDPEDDQHCTPGGDHGNYIMFARATSGDKRNNNKFSPCSLRSINAVLNTKARSVKGCFTEPLDAVCGNEVVEGAEECDCGWEEDCHEPCCFPMRVNPPQDQPPCRLRPAAFCSPSQGPCCSHDCRLKYGVMCREDNGCRTASYCDGQGPQCPSSTKKPNKTVCSEEFVCYNGECTGSICMAYGLESCQCLRTIHDPLIRSCELCCKLPGDEQSCKSSFEWNSVPYDVPDLYAKPGAPCDNYNGYCDVYQSCREIDPSGPLATLRKLLLSPEGAVILRRWLSEKWWGILLLFLAVTLTVAISARLLTRGHTKSFLSNILPHQSDLNFFHSRSSTRSHPACLVTSNSRKTQTSYVPRPRVSSAPENGWV